MECREKLNVISPNPALAESKWFSQSASCLSELLSHVPVAQEDGSEYDPAFHRDVLGATLECFD